MEGQHSKSKRRALDASLLGLLSALYFAQGLPSGLLGKALPSLLRDQGMSLPAIGFTALLALPWTLKFLWAPFLDRFWTRRRWLLTLNAATCGLMLLIAAQDFGVWVSGAFPLLLTVLFLMNLVAATQDIATDGLAVSRLAPRLRGLGNSAQVIGYKTGMIAGGGLLLWLAARFGWQLSYAALALLIAPVLLSVWFMSDTNAMDRSAAMRADWQGFKGYVLLFAGFLSKPRMGWWLLTVAVYKAGDSLASRMIGPFLTDQGKSLADIGLLTGVVGATAGLAGALMGGMFLLRLGHRNALLLFGGMQAAGFAGYRFMAGGAGGRPLHPGIWLSGRFYRRCGNHPLRTRAHFHVFPEERTFTGGRQLMPRRTPNQNHCLFDNLAVLKHPLNDGTAFRIHPVNPVKIIDPIPFGVKINTPGQAGHLRKLAVQIIGDNVWIA